MVNNREYYRTRKPFTPTIGENYTNENGYNYTCIGFDTVTNNPIFKSGGGWVCTCNSVGIYADGRIDWAASYNGHFEK